jgi:hypothetical protein
LDTRSLICSSVILDEPDCLDRDLRLDILINVEQLQEMGKQELGGLEIQGETAGKG